MASKVRWIWIDGVFFWAQAKSLYRKRLLLHLLNGSGFKLRILLCDVYLTCQTMLQSHVHKLDHKYLVTEIELWTRDDSYKCPWPGKLRLTSQHFLGIVTGCDCESWSSLGFVSVIYWCGTWTWVFVEYIQPSHLGTKIADELGAQSWRCDNACCCLQQKKDLIN